MNKFRESFEKYLKYTIFERFKKVPGSTGIKITILVISFLAYFIYDVLRDIAKEKLADSIQGVKFTSEEVSLSSCAKGANRYYVLDFSSEILIDLDFEKMLLFEEYRNTDEYNDNDNSSDSSSNNGHSRSYLKGYELAFTYRMGDQLILGTKGFPFILRRNLIGTSKLFQQELNKVNLDILKVSLKNKSDGPSPLSDGLWGLKTSEGNFAAILINGMPSPKSYPSIPANFNPKIEICYFENSWF
jgi:hypothetical protein